jgi:hypothetical protein
MAERMLTMNFFGGTVMSCFPAIDKGVVSIIKSIDTMEIRGGPVKLASHMVHQ